MLRKKDSIPDFVKDFEEEFFSYTLNLNEEQAEGLLKKEIELSDVQNNVLDDIIRICRSFRIQGIDENDLDYTVYFRLRDNIIDNKTHVLNHWRTQSGGTLPEVDNKDELVKLFQVLGIEAYPAFLLKVGKMGHFMKGISISHHHFLGNRLKDQIIKDDNLKLLFNVKGESDLLGTRCSFKASTGRASSIQLVTFVDLILLNSYYLMLLDGQDDISSYLNSIDTNINLIRKIAVNKSAKVPVYIGYSNVAFPENTFFNIPQGQLMSFDSKFLKILPHVARPTIAGGSESAFVYKGKFLYVFEFQEEEERKGNFKWPKESERSREKLDQIDEDLNLAINLSCERTPAVSLSRQWIIIFDPLKYGANMSWSSNDITPTPYHKCSNQEIGRIEKWCKKIYETDDTKIRYAIRKTISSISHRQNPIDGFIDGIVAWENLFGANAELSFRISAAISCLLEKDKTKRKEFYKEIKKAYDKRSTIVHGVKEINHKEATMFRDFAVKVILNCIAKLYENQGKLINMPDRSLTILLEHK